MGVKAAGEEEEKKNVQMWAFGRMCAQERLRLNKHQKEERDHENM